MTIQTPLQLVITIGIIALGTFLIRALPFFLFPAGKETPRVVAYLGAARPSASSVTASADGPSRIFSVLTACTARTKTIKRIERLWIRRKNTWPFRSSWCW